MPSMRPFDYGKAVSRGTQNAMAQMQTQAYPEQQRNAMRSSMLQNRLAAVDYIGKSAPMVTPDNYQTWKADLEQSQIAAPGQLPDQYDPQFMQQLGDGAQQQLASMAPASVREYEYFSGLPEDQQQQFMSLQRGGFTLGGQRYGAGTEAGLQQRPVVTAEETARGEGIVSKGKGLGTATAKRIEEGIGKIEDIGSNIRNLNEVVRLVEKEGAETGPLINKLPSFRRASVELDNMRNRLGLDVIGSVTFGALSESELNMALDTALPTNLQGPALIEWAQNKIQAQEKLRNYLQDQVSYLSQPGNTMSGWYEMQSGRWQQQGVQQPAGQAMQKAPAQQPAGQAPSAAVQYLMQNDSPQMRQMFQQKYGYLPEGM